MKTFRKGLREICKDMRVPGGLNKKKNSNQRKVCVSVIFFFFEGVFLFLLDLSSVFPEKAIGPDYFHTWFLPEIDCFLGFVEFFLFSSFFFFFFEVDHF